MNRIAGFLTAWLVALAATGLLGSAPAQAAYTQPELDRMLAPIALYPDALLTQILQAATRPLEVVEAARWSRARPGLSGDAALRAAEREPWHPSVKALLAFPQILDRMDQNLDWTKSLGDAFFVQEPVVMETIQSLRRRARAAGQLYSDERLSVIEENGAIIVAPTETRVVHLPYYDPWIVYGSWWWPAHPPVSWAPWPGYVVVRRPGVAPSFWWGTGIVISTHLWPGRFDWQQRRFHLHAHPTPHRAPAIRHEPQLPRVAPAAVPHAPRPVPHATPHPIAPQPERIAPRFAAPQATPHPVRPPLQVAPPPTSQPPLRAAPQVVSPQMQPTPQAAPPPASPSLPRTSPYATQPAPSSPAPRPAPHFERPPPKTEPPLRAEPRADARRHEPAHAARPQHANPGDARISARPPHKDEQIKGDRFHREGLRP